MQACTQTSKCDDAQGEPPLCVDLDGTLILGDTLKISLRTLLQRRPWELPGLAMAVLRGRAWFKKKVADLIVPDPGCLPYIDNVIVFLKQERQRGRRLILATAADERVGRAVAEHVRIFEAVIGSDGRFNLKGLRKYQAIASRLSGAEFDYMGDSMADMAILQKCRRAYLVRPSRSLEHKARLKCRVEHVFR